MLSDFEKLTKRLMEKLDLSKDQIMKMVESKKKRIGEGYLTNGGALFLIASDFGVTLAEELEIEKISPIDTITIPNISKNDLQDKFKLLKSDKTKKEISNTLIPYTFIGLIGGIILTITGIFGIEGFEGSIFTTGIVIEIASVIGIIISKKFSRKNLNSKESIFLEFYEVYQKTQEYGIREFKQDMTKYTNVIYDLQSFIHSWTRTISPSTISELPDNISSNLKNKVIPQFKENNIDNIKHFKNIIEKITMFCHDQEPTAELLRVFNDEISSYKVVEKIKEQKSPQDKLNKLITIAPISGIILFITLHIADASQIHASIGYSVTLSALILIGVLTIRNKK